MLPSLKLHFLTKKLIIRRQHVDSFLQRFKNKIKGTLRGFDRIIFKGYLQGLLHANGAMNFLQSKNILNKDFKSWAIEQSATLVHAAETFALEASGRPITYLNSCHLRKEEIAHQRQQELGLSSGLIGVWSCLESCSTFRARFNAFKKFPQLQHDFARCKHLYFYFDHADYGFLSVRLQTWFPFSIQIALNGREWLRRSLDKNNIAYALNSNKFLHVENYDRAQTLLDQQLDTDWPKLLCRFLPQTFPDMGRILGPEFSYYWTLWQSEWATDYIFSSPGEVLPVMNDLLRHALITGTSDRILRYMGRPVDANGQPHPLADPEVITRAGQWYDGMRVRHWVDGNSVKAYNEHNVLRCEVTINHPEKFRVFRLPQGESEGPKKRMPLRKGVADVALRTQVSSEVHQRFMEQMASLNNDEPVRSLLEPVIQSFTHQGRKIRALDVTGKDRELLLAISDPRYSINGMTNCSLREQLCKTVWGKSRTSKQLSARLSRHLKLLREHGLIRKLPRQNKYVLTDDGRNLTSALNALLSASTKKLIDDAA